MNRFAAFMYVFAPVVRLTDISHCAQFARQQGAAAPHDAREAILGAALLPQWQICLLLLLLALFAEAAVYHARTLMPRAIRAFQLDQWSSMPSGTQRPEATAYS